MIRVALLVILACASSDSAQGNHTHCEKLDNVYQKLEWAETMIRSAREKMHKNVPGSLAMDCEDLLNMGEKRSGVYTVRPMNRILSEPISVYCDMETDGGGWTVIQRRGNFSHEPLYFHKDWKAYKKGFGNLKEDFWLGNDIIHALSNQKLYSIRFDLGTFDGNKAYALYSTFWIDDEARNYTLHVQEYSGNAGDSLLHHSEHQFTTKDRDNDHEENINCAQVLKGGWWYTECHPSNLNGQYHGRVPPNNWEGIIWYSWKGEGESLAFTEMKIRKIPSWVK